LTFNQRKYIIIIRIGGIQTLAGSIMMEKNHMTNEPEKLSSIEDIEVDEWVISGRA